MCDHGPREARLQGEKTKATPTLKQFPLRTTAVFAPTALLGFGQFGPCYLQPDESRVRAPRTHERPLLEDKKTLTVTFRARDPKHGAVDVVTYRYTGHGTVLGAVEKLMGVGRRDSRDAISFLDCFPADGVLVTPHLSRLVEGLDVDELAKQARKFGLVGDVTVCNCLARKLAALTASCGSPTELMGAYGIERAALGEPLRRDYTEVTVATALLEMGKSVCLHHLLYSEDSRLDDVAALSKAIGRKIVLTDFRTVNPGNDEDTRPYYEAAASDGPRTRLFLVRGVKDHGGSTLCIEVLPSGLCRCWTLNVRHLQQVHAVVSDASDLIQWLALCLFPEGGVVDNPGAIFDGAGSIIGYRLDDAAILASTRGASWLSQFGRVGCFGRGESGGTGLTVVCEDAAKNKYGLVPPGATVSPKMVKDARRLLLDEPECRLATLRIEGAAEALWEALGLTKVEADARSKAVEWRHKGATEWNLAASGLAAAEAMGIIVPVAASLRGARRKKAERKARNRASDIVSALCVGDQSPCYADTAARFEARRVEEAVADVNAAFVAPEFGDERLIRAANAMAKAVASIELDDDVDGARQHSGRGQGGGRGSKKPRGRLPSSDAWATGFKNPAGGGGSKKPGKRGRGGGPPGGDGDPPDGNGDSDGGRGGGPKKRPARSKKKKRAC